MDDKETREEIVKNTVDKMIARQLWESSDIEQKLEFLFTLSVTNDDNIQKLKILNQSLNNLMGEMVQFREDTTKGLYGHNAHIKAIEERLDDTSKKMNEAMNCLDQVIKYIDNTSQK